MFNVAVFLGTDESEAEISEILSGTGWELGGSFNQYLRRLVNDEYTPIYRLMVGDWVVVSSEGTVRVADEHPLEKEFGKK
jgi:hypothetical protein